MQEVRSKVLVLLTGLGIWAIQDARAGTIVTCQSFPGGTVVVGNQSYPQPDIVDCEFSDDGLGGWDYGDPYTGGGGGGGSGTSPNVFPKATNHPNQTYPATCRSDIDTRHFHAANDTAWTQARRLATG